MANGTVEYASLGNRLQTDDNDGDVDDDDVDNNAIAKQLLQVALNGY